MTDTTKFLDHYRYDHLASHELDAKVRATSYAVEELQEFARRLQELAEDIKETALARKAALDAGEYGIEPEIEMLFAVHLMSGSAETYEAANALLNSAKKMAALQA